MKAISLEVRHLALDHYFSFKNVKLTCQTFKISRVSLWRFKRLFELGSLQPKIKTQPKIFKPNHRDYILCLAKKRSVFYSVYTIKLKFKQKYKMSISSTSIRRILKSENMVYKNVYVKSSVSKKKRVFKTKIKHVPINRLLSVDEMGFGHDFIYPSKSWWYRGHANVIRRKRTTFTSKQKSVICVTSSKEIINYQWSNTAINTKAFMDFLRISLIGYSGYSIILDNVSFHKSKRVMAVLNELNVSPIFIDPYSPEQNPIEEVFSNVKRILRLRHPNNSKEFTKSLKLAMMKQTKHSLNRYFKRSCCQKN